MIPKLSRSYVRRYESIFRSLNIEVPAGCRARGVDAHIGYARLLTEALDLRRIPDQGVKKFSIQRLVDLERLVRKGVSKHEVQRVGAMVCVGGERFRRCLSELEKSVDDMEKFVRQSDPLEQTEVGLQPSRNLKLVRNVDGDSSFVALQMPISELPRRFKVQQEVDRIADLANKSGSLLKWATRWDYGFVLSRERAAVWMIMPNLGLTLEDDWKLGRICGVRRARILNSIGAFVRAMKATNRYFGGLAPRNLFVRGRSLTVIDFERLERPGRSIPRMAELMYWYSVWFGDCLTLRERNSLFAKLEAGEISPKARIRSDATERAFFGRPWISWSERCRLFEYTLALERVHRRRQPDPVFGWKLFGHQLGHFWGDFLPRHVEADILRLWELVRSHRRLRIIFLELFELLAECDIQDTMVNCRLGRAPSSAVTTTVVRILLGSDLTSLLRFAGERLNSWQEMRIINYAVAKSAIIEELNHQSSSAEMRGFIRKNFLGRGSESRAQTKEIVRIVQEGVKFVTGKSRARRVLTFKSNAELIAILSERLPIRGSSGRDLFKELRDRVIANSIAQSDPNYFAFPDSGNAVSSLAGSVASTFLNQNLIAVERSAPSATFAEIQVIEWLRSLIGFESAELDKLNGVGDVAGLWTPGGHMSNHIAMLTALNRAHPEVRSVGLRGLAVTPKVVLCGDISHYSHNDSAFHLGLGWDNVIKTPATPGLLSSASAMESALHCQQTGTRVFMLVAFAGNCRTTGIDDLNSLADLAHKHKIWLHVDACHGGNLVFDPATRKTKLRGIERADSVSIDPHKGLFTTYPSSYVLFRERGVLRCYSRHRGMVERKDIWDLGLISPFFGSRGFESLKTWMLMKQLGTTMIGKVVKYRDGNIRLLEQLLRDSGMFVCLNKVDFYRVTFVFSPVASGFYSDLSASLKSSLASEINRITSAINTRIYQGGEFCFDEHTLRDTGDEVGLGSDKVYTVIAACIGNPLVEFADVVEAVKRLVCTGGEYLASFNDVLKKLGTLVHEHTETRSGPAGW